MKKFISVVLTGVMVFALTACGSSNSDGQTDSVQSASSVVMGSIESSESSAQENSVVAENSAVESTTESSAQESTESSALESTEETGEKVLVAYFSWSGNTEELAGMIQSETGADMFEITPETLYTDDYNELLDVAQQEQRDNARPALAGTVENWEDYSTVFVGYPNWWGGAPMIILSFLESYDCTGKTIVPFCTSGGGGFGSSVSSIEGSAVGAEMAEGLHVSGSRVGNAETAVAEWIDGLNLAE